MSDSNYQLDKWKGNFGKQYTIRNKFTLKGLNDLYKKNFGLTRNKMNRDFLGKLDRSVRILEVGTNSGLQLLLLKKIGFKNLFGIEPQDYALEQTKKIKGIYVIKGNIFDIPFKDDYFDLVFTSGVLIYISPKLIKNAVAEIYRCSKKFIWGFEYFSNNYKKINYRGKNNLLWKANFSKIYTDSFPDLKVVKQKFYKYPDKDNLDQMFLLKK